MKKKIKDLTNNEFFKKENFGKIVAELEYLKDKGVSYEKRVDIVKEKEIEVE